MNKNKKSGLKTKFKSIFARWCEEDYPGGEPQFDVKLLAKDIAIFVFIPVSTVIVYKGIENAGNSPKQIRRPEFNRDQSRIEASKSQIIDFKIASNGHGSGSAGVSSGYVKKSPGSLVKLKLLNVIETYSNAPVHAQIIDRGLGANLLGGTLIGDAVSDPNFERISITFKFARDPRRDNIAVPISARALSLDGSLGIDGTTKEGYFARSALGSANGTVQGGLGKIDSLDLKDVIVKALASGFIQEFGNSAEVARNRAQVLTLQPGSVFFAELTDFFPGTKR